MRDCQNQVDLWGMLVGTVLIMLIDMQRPSHTMGSIIPWAWSPRLNYRGQAQQWVCMHAFSLSALDCGYVQLLQVPASTSLPCTVTQSCELHKLSLLKFLLSGYCTPGTWREFRGCGFQGLNFQGQQGFLSQQIPYPMSHLTDLGISSGKFRTPWTL